MSMYVDVMALLDHSYPTRPRCAGSCRPQDLSRHIPVFADINADAGSTRARQRDIRSGHCTACPNLMHGPISDDPNEAALQNS